VFVAFDKYEFKREKFVSHLEIKIEKHVSKIFFITEKDKTQKLSCEKSGIRVDNGHYKKRITF